MITLFWRGDIAERAAPCDVADVAVFAIDDDSPHGYIGAAWGRHVPDDCIDYTICDPEYVDGILTTWGLYRKKPEADNA